jgi:hypothetical protein
METHRDEMKSHQCSKAPCRRRNPQDAGATLYGIVIALTAGGAGSSLGSHSRHRRLAKYDAVNHCADLAPSTHQQYDRQRSGIGYV